MTLQVEQLESRLNPSTLTFSAGVLTYQGDATPHTVYVFDVDGKGDDFVFAPGVSGLPGGNGFGYFPGVKIASFNSVAADAIQVYELAPVSNAGSFSTGPEQGAFVFTLAGGATATFSDPYGVSAGELMLEAFGGQGSFTATVGGTISAGAQAFALTYNSGGLGVTLNVTANVAGTFTAYNEPFAGNGTYNLTYDGVITGTVTADVFAYSDGNTYNLSFTAEAGSTGNLGGYSIVRGTDAVTESFANKSGGTLHYDLYLLAPVGDPNVVTLGDIDVYRF